MAEMAMIEDERGKITWECSSCKSILKDKSGFEDKVKKCPKCDEEITQFHNLFDEDGDYV